MRGKPRYFYWPYEGRLTKQAACAAIRRKVERGTGLEPATICLEGRDSTTELPPLAPTNPQFLLIHFFTHFFLQLEPGTGIEPVTSSLPRTRSTN